jgi:hypothetical protein
MHATRKYSNVLACACSSRWIGLAWLASVLASTGCLSPFRSWRAQQDEVALLKALNSPDPWEAEQRLRRGDDRDGRGSLTSREGQGMLGNASSPGRSGFDPRHQPYDDEQAELEAALAAAPPHLRGLLQRQWEAARRQAEADAYAYTDAARGATPSNIRPRSRADYDAARPNDATHLSATPTRPNAPLERFSATQRPSSELPPRTRTGRISDVNEEPRPRTVPHNSPTRSPSVQLALRDEYDPEEDAQFDEDPDPEYLDRPHNAGAMAYYEEGAEEEAWEVQVAHLPAPPSTRKRRLIASDEPLRTHEAGDALHVPLARRSGREGPTHATAQTAAHTPAQSAAARIPAQPTSNIQPAAANTANTTRDSVVTASATSPATQPTHRLANPPANPAANLPAQNPIAQNSIADDSHSTSLATDWRGLAREALRRMAEEQTAAAERSPAEQLHFAANQRLLSLALGDLNQALEPIEGLQSHEQEYFRQQLQALHNAIDPAGNPVLARRWTLALDAQRKASTHLAAVSNLEVRSAAFCTSVESFGVITKFAAPQFRPNQEMLLYCELDNFVAEPVKDGYETQLQGSYEIVDSAGRRIADQLLPVDSDVCRNQRRDYFIAYRIYMPSQIPAGRYQLKLTIEDMKGRKFGQTALDFQIVP